jgi:hypothetical protein
LCVRAAHQSQWQHWTHKTQDEDKPKTMATLDTQDPGRRQTKDNGNEIEKQTKITNTILCDKRICKSQKRNRYAFAHKKQHHEEAKRIHFWGSLIA